MKTKAIHLLATLALVLTVQAGPEKRQAGPNGGRVLTAVEPHAEFAVTTDRKVKITFLDAAGKPIAPAEQVVTVTTGERSAPVKLAFTKSGNALISDKALPEGNDLPTVVQIKATPSAKSVVEKFNLNLAVCPGCKLQEFACTCEHTH